MARTLAQLQAMVRRRMGWPSTDSFVSDAELRDMLRESQRELHDFMIATFGTEYAAVSETITIAAGGVYATPTTFVMTRVHRVAAKFDSVSCPLRRRDVANEILDLTPRTWQRGMDISYRMMQAGVTPVAGGEPYQQVAFFFHPLPATTQLIHVVYTAKPSTMSLSTAVHSIGYDEYLVLDTMIKLKEMEEVDASMVIAQKERLIARIESTAVPLDMAQAPTISDARTADKGRADWRRYP